MTACWQKGYLFAKGIQLLLTQPCRQLLRFHFRMFGKSTQLAVHNIGSDISEH